MAEWAPMTSYVPKKGKKAMKQLKVRKMSSVKKKPGKGDTSSMS